MELPDRVVVTIRTRSGGDVFRRDQGFTRDDHRESIPYLLGLAVESCLHDCVPFPMDALAAAVSIAAETEEPTTDEMDSILTDLHALARRYIEERQRISADVFNERHQKLMRQIEGR